MHRYKKVRESVKADEAPAELSEDLQHVLQVRSSPNVTLPRSETAVKSPCIMTDSQC